MRRSEYTLVRTYLEPLLGCAPVAGGEYDGVERVPLAIGELHHVPVHALHRRQDLDLARLDLGVGADVDDGVGGGLELHGEGPNGGPAEAVAGGVPEHDGTQEQHDPVDQPHRQVPVQRHRHVPDLLGHQVKLHVHHTPYTVPTTTND